MAHPDKPTLYLANHPKTINMAPTLLRLSATERHTALVGNAVWMMLFALPIIRSRVKLIPVRIPIERRGTESKAKKWLTIILEKIGNQLAERPEHQPSYVTNEMANHLSEGDNVFMAPSGSLFKDANWRKGIIYLLRKAQKEHLDFALALVSIPNTLWDKHSMVIFNHWIEAVELAGISLEDEADAHLEAVKLQLFYEKQMEAHLLSTGVIPDSETHVSS